MKEKALDFYSKNKKGVLIAGVVLIIILVLAFKGASKQDKWKDIVLNDYVPKIKEGKLNITTNESDEFYISTDKVNDKYYNTYKNECIKMGYTIDSKEDGSSYEAYNKDGYKIRVYIISDRMYVDLDAPEKLSNITWPTNGLASLLPVPKSTIGKVITDSSKYFRIQLGEISKEEYNNYVKSCEDKGFTNDYDKQEDYYSAKNADKYNITIKYLGNNNIEIYIEAPEENNNSTDNNTPSIDNNKPSNDNDKPNTNDSNMVNGMRKEFKNAMDSYEKFMNEYVSFMKKYNNNPTDMSLISDYTKYLSKYSEFVSDFEKWDGNDLNTKEAAYYLEVQTRVSKKLLEVAN